jgi:flagellar export protein FliJ
MICDTNEMSQHGTSYPLAAVLENLLAEQQRRQGAIADVLAVVAEAQAELQTARQRRDEADARLDEAQSELNRTVERGVTAAELQRRQGYVETCRRELSRCAQAVDAAANRLRGANDRLAVARAELTEANRRVKLQEKHRENWENERRRERQRKEQSQEDEIGRMLHQRRTRDD